MGTHSFHSSSSPLVSSVSQSQAIAVACASSSHIFAYIPYQPIQRSLADLLTCATTNLILAASVGFTPIKFLINFLRKHACKYFIFGCVAQLGLAWVHGSGL